MVRDDLVRCGVKEEMYRVAASDMGAFGALETLGHPWALVWAASWDESRDQPAGGCRRAMATKQRWGRNMGFLQ